MARTAASTAATRSPAAGEWRRSRAGRRRIECDARPVLGSGDMRQIATRRIRSQNDVAELRRQLQGAGQGAGLDPTDVRRWTTS